MVDFWYIDGDFSGARSGRIGASDIPALIQNPDAMNESLAGYGQTPLTLWKQKTGRIQREPAGLAAEMGHFLESKAIELFNRRFDPRNKKFSTKGIRSKIIAELDGEYLGKDQMENSNYIYHSQFYTDSLIAHPDCLFIPSGFSDIKNTVDGITVDFSKPFIVEAKSANFFATKRKGEGEEEVKGYNFKLRGWQGVPLKHYLQLQFQLALFHVDVAYLALISNTSDFSVWRIDANPGHQESIMKTAERMAWHVQNDKPPLEMVFNQEDIKNIYPDINENYIVIGDDRKALVDDAVDLYRKGCRIEKRGTAAKIEALDTMALLLGEFRELRDGKGIIAKWQSRNGFERASVTEIKKQFPEIYDKLLAAGIIKKSAGGRSVVIK